MSSPLSDSPFEAGRGRRAPWWIWLIATVVHVPVAVLMLATVWRHTTEGWRLYDLRKEPDRVATAPVAFSLSAPRTAAPKQSPVTRPPAEHPRPRNDVAPAPARDAAPPPAAQNIPPLGVPVEQLPPGGASSAPVMGGTAVAGIPPIGPAYGSGVLWGRAPQATAEQLAQRVLGLSEGRGLDSNTTARLQRYIDSMATEVSLRKPPSWVTSIGGKKVGVDSKWIYLGPVRIPSMLLALLPINVQANPTQVEFNKRLNSMKEDLYFAAQRSQNYAEFRSAVNQLRAEKEAEQEFKANQRGGGPLPGKNQP